MELNNNFLPEQYLLFMYDYINLYDEPLIKNELREIINNTQKYYIEKDEQKYNVNYYIFISKMLTMAIDKADNLDELKENVKKGIEIYINYKIDKMKKLK